MTTFRTITTTCSGCARPVRLSLATTTASVQGLGTSDVFTDDTDLLTWDCPACDYADSYEID